MSRHNKIIEKHECLHKIDCPHFKPTGITRSHSFLWHERFRTFQTHLLYLLISVPLLSPPFPTIGKQQKNPKYRGEGEREREREREGGGEGREREEREREREIGSNKE